MANPPPRPIKSLEVPWLKATLAYELFDETLMPDTEWDQLGKELHERRLEWSPYFESLIPGGKEGGFNVGTTGSGVLWRETALGMTFYRSMAEVYGRDPLGVLVVRGAPKRVGRKGKSSSGAK